MEAKNKFNNIPGLNEELKQLYKAMESVSGITVKTLPSVKFVPDGAVYRIKQANGTYKEFKKIDDRFIEQLNGGSTTTDSIPQGTNNQYFNNSVFNSAFNSKTTDNLREGIANLYHTVARVQAIIDANLIDDVFAIKNAADETKRLVFDNSEINTGEERVITSPDFDFNFNEPVFDNTVEAPDFNATTSLKVNDVDIGAIYAPIANPTFTGTVSGITKDMVGLGNADNTSDADKPVSDATQMALDFKSPSDSPTFTGTLTAEEIQPTTDDTHYLGKNDDDTPKAWKGLILKDQAGTGKYYRLEVYNDALRIVDLAD